MFFMANTKACCGKLIWHMRALFKIKDGLELASNCRLKRGWNWENVGSWHDKGFGLATGALSTLLCCLSAGWFGRRETHEFSRVRVERLLIRQCYLRNSSTSGTWNIYFDGTQFQSYDYFSLASFLEACPALESFHIWAGEYDDVWQDPALQDSNSDLLHIRRIPEFSHANLRRVSINRFFPSKSMIELTYLIIENASSLRCLKLDTSYGFYARVMCKKMNKADVIQALEAVDAIKIGHAALMMIIFPPQAGGFIFVAWSMPRLALFAAVLALQQAVAGAATGAGLRPDCQTTCGDVAVPFPFGIGAGCYHSAGFNLTCDRSLDPPRLLLGDAAAFQVLNVSIVNATVRAARVGGINITYGGNASVEGRGAWRGLGDGGPFALSEDRNELIVVWGCDVVALLTDGGNGNSSNVTISGCASFCPGTDAGGQAIAAPAGSTMSLTEDRRCTGVGCCQMPISVGRDSYQVRLRRLNPNPPQPPPPQGAGDPTVVLIAEQGWIAEASKSTRGSPLPVTFDETAVPVLLGWMIASTRIGADGEMPVNSTCPADAARSACKSSHSSCRNVSSSARAGYVCDCDAGFEGNPYLAAGCQDINECERAEEHGCFGECINTAGSFLCRCPAGTIGNHTQRNGCFRPVPTLPPRSFSTGLSIGVGVSSAASLILIVIMAILFIRKQKRRRAKKIRQKYFKQNRGQLLQQLVAQRADIAERMIIPLGELKKATNNFDRARELGGGGHGTVYKGILSDLHVVAIKKSKIAVQREIDEFINEVAILSQINHRNVVKLFGCCLETEVPLLVYEFVSNGTLYSHLHVSGPRSLLWSDRLRIATETAKAIAYLHSSVSIPIIHRDIKSTNILLDDTLTSKVSDFGASRCIPVDQTGVTTKVQGTLGYMDPTYYYTQRLTEKSDVYSFGVILVELLTRKKPFSHLTPNGEGLVAHFVTSFTEGNLVGVLDLQVMEEADMKVVEEVATLAVTCVNLRGEDRPTMRQVEMALEGIQASRENASGNLSAEKFGESNNVASDFMPSQEGRSMTEGTRQYSLEEEFLLSSRCIVHAMNSIPNFVSLTN
uniref:Protein kinase domain-containing protein n=1 Tax=Oryza punctata TaxID=4537 RepID=A0A0E0M4K8_ORYPU